MDSVAPLAAFGRADIPRAGGKGANLGELVRAGFPVPDGFVVGTGAYLSVLRGADFTVEELLVDGDGGKLRAALEAMPMPAAVAEPIRAAYAALDAAGGGQGTGPVAVAVRSSATAEDLPGAAFAGQQDTYLNIVGEVALLDAVRRCWASLWTDRAIAYRAERGIASAEVSIAVVVQRMIPAELAGVMFTADPVSGDRERIVVDASSGLGEAVVSGLVTPDHYLLTHAGGIVSFTPGRREVVITGMAGGGTRETAGSGEPDRLAPGTLAELAGLGTRVAEHFGRPQDIEWAYADGRLRLLQARPMTALPPPPVRLNRIERRMGEILLDYITDRPYPIDVTTWLPHGPVGMMTKVARHFGVRGLFADFLVERDEVVYQLRPRAPRPGPRVLLAPVLLARAARRHDPAAWTSDPRFAAFQADTERLARVDPAELDWAELTALPRRAFGLVEPITGLRRDYLPGTASALVRLLLALALRRRRALYGELIIGGGTRTEDNNRALAELAELVRDDPALGKAIDTAINTSPGLPGLAGFPEFRAALESYLAEYGHRETASPILVTPPTAGEAPEIVLNLIKVLAGEPPAPSDRAERALDELLAGIRSPRRRARLRRLVERARAGVAFREDSHFHFTKPLPILRRALLEIGARLRRAGLLDAPEEVFHLRLPELETLPPPEKLAAPRRRALRDTVRARAATRAELSGVRLIDPGAIYPPKDKGDALVTGTPTSGGRATGPVKVVRGPADFGKLTTGDVLVCGYTNPAWTPLFARAAAVVVDSGGAASHAAIVAREYGIPAIMGTADGTSVLTDGQVVLVDGAAGRVTLP